MSQMIRLTIEQRAKIMADAKSYIREQLNECGDSTWVEGWICGFTDHVHTAYEPLRDDLMEFYQLIRK